MAARLIVPVAALATVFTLGAAFAVAQDVPDPGPRGVVDAPGGVVRWLDKVSGETGDLELSRGQSVVTGRLTITLDDCRYPGSDGATDAYAHLTIFDSLRRNAAFSGWMVASSPALSALDNSRYDVWILRCLTS